MGITLLDATHYATEQVVLRPLAECLTACCPDVRFAVGCGGDALCFTGGLPWLHLAPAGTVAAPLWEVLFCLLGGGFFLAGPKAALFVSGFSTLPPSERAPV